MLTPFYRDDLVRLYCGKCESILPQLEVRADLCLTDPPYGVEKADWDNYLPLDWYWLVRQKTDRVLLCVGNSNIPLVAKALPDYCQLVILRNKNGMQSTKYSFDNFIPCFQLGAWEYRQVQNVIDFSIRGEMPSHPSPKPIEAMRKLVETFSDAGELIIDPFAGSGTTLVAAKLLGRPSIGIEMNEKYCQMIVDRLNKPIPLFEREAEQTELPLAATGI